MDVRKKKERTNKGRKYEWKGRRKRANTKEGRKSGRGKQV